MNRIDAPDTVPMPAEAATDLGAEQPEQFPSPWPTVWAFAAALLAVAVISSVSVFRM